MWESLREGFDLLLGDRGFCSLCDMYLLKRQGVDTIFRNHQARQMNWKQGKRLGRYDRLVVWKKPRKRPTWIEPDDYETLPAEWTVRVLRFQIPVKGFRTRSVTVATTLLNPVEFPAADIAELYGLRWSVELHFRDIKTTLAMDILRCLSPDLIHREFQMHWLAYNLIRSLMQEAALLHNAPLERLSFKGTLDTLRQWTPHLFAAESHPTLRTKLLRQFFRVIAHDLVPLRPHRSEPRAVKRRPKKFHLLNKPRHLMGNLPHINRRARKSKQPA